MGKGACVDDLLEPVLGTLQGVGGDRPLQLGGEEALEPDAGGLQPEGQVDRADQCLERARQNGRSPPRPDPLRPLPELQGAPQADAPGDPGKPGGADDRSPASGELALVGVGIAVVERLRDDQVDDGVAEELQPLVRLDALLGLLVGEAAVDERASDEGGIGDGEAEAPDQCGGVGRRAPTGSCVRRCNRRRPGRSGSSRRLRRRSRRRIPPPGS